MPVPLATRPTSSIYMHACSRTDQQQAPVRASNLSADTRQGRSNERQKWAQKQKGTATEQKAEKLKIEWIILHYRYRCNYRYRLPQLGASCNTWQKKQK